jgi:predicted RNase H-like HicB family nuclease
MGTCSASGASDLSTSDAELSSIWGKILSMPVRSRTYLIKARMVLAAAAGSAILKEMLRYHVAYSLPRGDDRMVVAEVLDFPGVFSQGFDLADARLMIASALQDIAQMHLEEGKALPTPNPDATAADADLIELLPLSVEAGAPKP